MNYFIISVFFCHFSLPIFAETSRTNLEKLDPSKATWFWLDWFYNFEEKPEIKTDERVGSNYFPCYSDDASDILAHCRPKSRNPKTGISCSTYGCDVSNRSLVTDRYISLFRADPLSFAAYASPEFADAVDMPTEPYSSDLMSYRTTSRSDILADKEIWDDFKKRVIKEKASHPKVLQQRDAALKEFSATRICLKIDEKPKLMGDEVLQELNLLIVYRPEDLDLILEAINTSFPGDAATKYNLQDKEIGYLFGSEKGIVVRLDSLVKRTKVFLREKVNYRKEGVYVQGKVRLVKLPKPALDAVGFSKATAFICMAGPSRYVNEPAIQAYNTHIRGFKGEAERIYRDEAWLQLRDLDNKLLVEFKVAPL